MPGTTELRQAIAVDDRALLLLYAHDCLRLARMAHGFLALWDAKLQEIIARP